MGKPARVLLRMPRAGAYSGTIWEYPGAIRALPRKPTGPGVSGPQYGPREGMEALWGMTSTGPRVRGSMVRPHEKPSHGPTEGISGVRPCRPGPVGLSGVGGRGGTDPDRGTQISVGKGF